MRGHTLGRVIREGEPIPNTNIPGLIGGFTGERVLRAPDDGIFHQLLDIGAMVQAGDVAGEVNGKPMICTISGVVRGMLADGTPVFKGMKSGDVDPRGEISYCQTASDKAIAIGGGVLQAILEYTGVLNAATGKKCTGGITMKDEIKLTKLAKMRRVRCEGRRGHSRAAAGRYPCAAGRKSARRIRQERRCVGL